MKVHVDCMTSRKLVRLPGECSPVIVLPWECFPQWLLPLSVCFLVSAPPWEFSLVSVPVGVPSWVL